VLRTDRDGWVTLECRDGEWNARRWRKAAALSP